MTARIIRFIGKVLLKRAHKYLITECGSVFLVTSQVNNNYNVDTSDKKEITLCDCDKRVD